MEDNEPINSVCCELNDLNVTFLTAALNLIRSQINAKVELIWRSLPSNYFVLEFVMHELKWTTKS